MEEDDEDGQPDTTWSGEVSNMNSTLQRGAKKCGCAKFDASTEFLDFWE
jgi:hypothetical protein